MSIKKPTVWDNIIRLTSMAFYFILNQMPIQPHKQNPLPMVKKIPNIIKEIQKPKEVQNVCTFMSWNIERGYHYDKLSEELKNIKADIMLTQESPIKDNKIDRKEQPHFILQKNYVYTPTFYAAKKSANYPFRHAGQMTQSKVAPLKTTSIQLAQVRSLNPSRKELIYSTRKALYTKYKTAKGSLGVYNVHLENFTRRKGRKQQLSTILEEVKKQKDTFVIIAGDFNTICGPFEYIKNYMSENGFVRAQTKGASCGPLLLDHIFHTPNLSIKASILNIHASDHKPIKAEIYFSKIMP